MVGKSFLYDEAAKVPLLLGWPGQLPEGARDTAHLTSGADVVPTVCDYAGVPAPSHMRGRSLRPLLEGDSGPWRDFVVAETSVTGRMVRTRNYKYIAYKDDPVDQLFDMQSDPWETRNLASDPAHAGSVREHRRLLAEWEDSLDLPGDGDAGGSVPMERPRT
jgi:choline-sulfatase